MKLNTTKRKRFRVSNKVKKVSSNDRFRLSISRSSKNISAQIIDDLKKVICDYETIIIMTNKDSQIISREIIKLCN